MSQIQRRDCPDCGDPLALKAISCRCGWGAKKGESKLSPEAKAARDAAYELLGQRSRDRMHENRASDSPLVAQIRAAYLKSPAFRLGIKANIAEHVDSLRTPGSDDEEIAA